MARKELPEGTVLLDVTDVSYASFAKNFLERTGHQALVCHGPTEDPCPLLTEAGCEKIDAAHGVVRGHGARLHGGLSGRCDHLRNP